MTAKPKKQKPTKQKFVLEVMVEIMDGSTWTKKAVRESIEKRLNPETAVCKCRVRKVDLD